MPLLVIFLARRPVSLARTIRRDMESLHFVHIMVVHASLREDVLTPSTPLPVATIVGAWGKHSMAILQIGCKNRDRRLTNALQIAEEAVLHILTILVVDAVGRLAL